MSRTAFLLLCVVIYVAAYGQIIYDQTYTPSTQGQPTFSYPANNYTYQAADDFTIPAGKSWTVERVDFYGGFASTSYAQYLKNWTAEIYSDKNNLPGELLYTATSAPPQNTTLGNAYVSFNPPIPLGNGTYWVSVFGIFDAQSLPTPNNNMTHSWSVFLRQTDTTPKVGQQWVWRENRNYIQPASYSGKWNAFGTTYATTYADLVFELIGTEYTGPPPANTTTISTISGTTSTSASSASTTDASSTGAAATSSASTTAASTSSTGSTTQVEGTTGSTTSEEGVNGASSLVGSSLIVAFLLFLL